MKTDRRLNPGVVYGPVNSRRLGVSLGLNLSGPGKYCSFNCAYCFRGFNEGRPDNPTFLETLPSPERLLDELLAWLTCHPVDKIEDWTVAGNAEPTDHPAFAQIIDSLVCFRNSHYPHIKITVFTNGMGLVPRINPQHKKVLAALGKVDRACLKLDSGRSKTWRRLARPMHGVTLCEWVDAVEELEGLIFQTMLVQGTIDHTTPTELSSLRRLYKRLRPTEVHMLTINKDPAHSGLRPVSQKELIRFANLIDDAVPCRMFY